MLIAIFVLERFAYVTVYTLRYAGHSSRAGTPCIDFEFWPVKENFNKFVVVHSYYAIIKAIIASGHPPFVYVGIVISGGGKFYRSTRRVQLTAVCTTIDASRSDSYSSRTGTYFFNSEGKWSLNSLLFIHHPYIKLRTETINVATYIKGERGFIIEPPSI